MAPDTLNRRETWPPDLRLRKRRDYQRVFQEGRTEATPYFVLRWRPNDKGVPRLGLQIGRRAASRAVVRNRWKRWAREVFRRHRHGWPAVDIVLVARPEMKELSFRSFEAAFLAAVQRIVRRWERLRSGSGST
ncbi:MAG: ribonuclease P protein component [Acidobacteria bacterium]|nr:ribonuclease P protein component [Acidobacteriota bacterium]MDW7985342.1 ribonuclease P protein component [Acidobacteriota bacterium]